MLPFDAYPDGGRKPGKRLLNGTCRREYGFDFQKTTGQIVCAYCGMSLVDEYVHWLMMSIDHVIPTQVGRALGIHDEWLDDYCNLALCCSACNGFGNRYKLAEEPVVRTWTWEEFLQLRDRVFSERNEQIRRLHKDEKEFYDRTWRSRCNDRTDH